MNEKEKITKLTTNPFLKETSNTQYLCWLQKYKGPSQSPLLFS